MNLQSILNKNSPWAHTELELGVLGVSNKLVKNVVHMSKKKQLKRTYVSSHQQQAAQTEQTTSFVLKEF